MIHHLLVRVRVSVRMHIFKALYSKIQQDRQSFSLSHPVITKK